MRGLKVRTARTCRLLSSLRVLAGACMVVFCLLALREPGAAQDLRYLRHQAWTTEDGLPQDSVSQIAQTGDGFLWVATEGGVARFDGVSFRIFDHHNERAFSSDNACCLLADPNGSLWIGTADGLLLYTGGHVTRFGEREGLPSSLIRALATSADGLLLVGTDNGFVVRKGDRFERSDQDEAPKGLHAANGGSQAMFWAYSNTSVTHKEAESSRQWNVGKELPGSRIETVFVDRHGTAWVGTNKGLALLFPSSAQATPVPALEGSVVLQVLEDQEGNYWIATETSGLHVLRPTKFRTEPGLADQQVTAIVPSTGGGAWVGTRQEGLRLVRNGVVTSPVPIEKLTSPLIVSLAPGESGSVWAGTPDGLNHVTASGAVEQITSANGLPDDYVQALASDGLQGVWVGTRRGLVHVVGARTELFSRGKGLPGDLVGGLLRSRTGTLWAATSGGLSRLGEEGMFANVPLGSSTGRGIVSAMAEDAEGGLWLGLRDGTLSRFAEGAVRTVHPSTAASPGIDGLEFDKNGDLWLRDREGVERIGKAELDAYLRNTSPEPCSLQAKRYGRPDGLPSVEVVQGSAPAIARMGNGELWFATRRGVAVADPDHLATNRTPPPVVIERFLADDIRLSPEAGPLRIPFGPVRFTVEYAGLSYTAPSEVRYRYKLEGLDQAWTEAGSRRSATYTNLRPGPYLFRVQASNNDGVWNEAGARLAFRVVPPFYRRWWFLALMVLCLAALGVGLYQLRLRSLQLRFDAVLAERNRLAREIHDTLAQDFVGVSLQLDLIAQLLGLRKVEAATAQVQQTRKLVNDGLAEARRSIWDLRANASQGSLPTRLAQVVERYGKGDLKIELKIGGAYRQLDPALESEVLRVAGEALSNVQRHSGASKALVNLRYESDMLMLQVQDWGKGFVVEDALGTKDRFGLRGMGERAAATHAELRIESTPGSGTTVVLASPVPPAGR